MKAPAPIAAPTVPPPPAIPTTPTYVKMAPPGLAATGGGRMGNTFLTMGQPSAPKVAAPKSLLGQ